MDFSEVKWLEADQNPYGIRVLDCRSLTSQIVSSSKDKTIVDQFLQLRTLPVESIAGQLPDQPVKLSCSLQYPPMDKLENGLNYRAELMEDKWDIFLHDGYLYFARSWSGLLHFRARIEFGGTEATVTSIEADSEIVGGDAGMAIQEVDFLIKSHLFCFECPHPLPNSMRDVDHQKIAVWSFSSFGRRGYFGSFTDTTAVRIPPRSGD